jgi:hypothetical protein
MQDDQRIPGSFRDPSGFMFCHQGSLYRQVNAEYREHYDHLMSSGLYDSLVSRRWLVRHEEVTLAPPCPEIAYKIVKPEPVPFLSYPYEWSFSQLQDAAAVTLEIQKTALDFGMSLKDCSAYNIQFVGSRPVLIDTLSFEKYRVSQPWVAYRQFCQHFLAPLAVASHTDVRLSQLLRVHIDGLPLDLASTLLPRHTWLHFSLLSHIHLHARSQRRYARKTVDVRGLKMSELSLRGLLLSLEGAVGKLRWKTPGTEWADYYADTNYTSAGLAHKEQLIEEFLDVIRPRSVWDLGGNVGRFGRRASNRGILTVCLDHDPVAVEKNYQQCKRKKEGYLLPLLIDLTNPSPGIGWENRERAPLLERGPADAVFALALLHHLAISNNLPFDHIASFLSRLCHWLVVEFVPKEDTQVQRLLATRQDIFPDYNRQAFEAAFARQFLIQKSVPIKDSQRILYLMSKREIRP